VYHNKSSRKGSMKTTIQNLDNTEFGNSTRVSMLTLDSSTRLRMAPEKSGRRIAVVVEEPTTASKVYVAKEAAGVSLLLAVFTAAFWLLITFIRSH